MIHRLRTIALFTAASMLAGGVAQAAWTSSGSGSASAAATTINSPTNVATNVSGQTVTVSWAAPASGAAATTYSVTRAGTTICGAVTTPLQCVETSVPSGAHTYAVVSKRSAWTSAAATAGASVTVPASLAFTATLASGGTKVAGTAFDVQITATSDGATQSSYTGTKAITFSGPAASPSGSTPTYPASVSFTNGVGTANITLPRAESATLTVTEGSRSAATAVTVIAAQPALRFTSSSTGNTSAAANCANGSVSLIDNKAAWTSKVSRGTDRFGNPTATTGAVTVTLSVVGTASAPSPSSLTIAAGVVESATSFSSTLENGNPPASTITASASGHVSATCAITR